MRPPEDELELALQRFHRYLYFAECGLAPCVLEQAQGLIDRSLRELGMDERTLARHYVKYRLVALVEMAADSAQAQREDLAA